MRNGDRWTVNVGARDVLYLTNFDNGHRHAIPVDYIAAGHLTVDYASTINRAQGATVDEAHLIIDERTNAKQLYVGITRGRNANHVHAAPPACDTDQHGPTEQTADWSTAGAVAAALDRQPDQVSATERRRQLRGLFGQTQDSGREFAGVEPMADAQQADPEAERVEAAVRRLEVFTLRPRTRGIER